MRFVIITLLSVCAYGQITQVPASSSGGGSGITALTGNVVASGPGSAAATIQAGVVTSAMLAGSIDPAKIIGGTFGAGNYVYPGNVTIGTTFLTDTSTVDVAQYIGNFANDAYQAVSGGSYTDGSANPGAVFEVNIINPGTPDQFRWRKNGGSWSVAANVTGAAQALSNGVTVTFGATTGDGTGDTWLIQTAQRIDGVGVLMSGHSGFGNAATINGNDVYGGITSSVLTLKETATRDIGFGVHSIITSVLIGNVPIDGQQYYHFNGYTETDASNTHTVSTLAGIYHEANHRGSGAATYVAGGTFLSANYGAGLVDNLGSVFQAAVYGSGGATLAYGSYHTVPYNRGAGTIGLSAGVYVKAPSANTGIITSAPAFYNENMTGQPGTIGAAYARLSDGGYNLLKTGAAGTVGLAVQAFASQTANLFQTLASDGTTVTSQIDASGVFKASGYKSSDGTTGATTTCTLLSITAITVKNGLITGCS